MPDGKNEISLLVKIMSIQYFVDLQHFIWPYVYLEELFVSLWNWHMAAASAGWWGCGVLAAQMPQAALLLVTGFSKIVNKS